MSAEIIPFGKMAKKRKVSTVFEHHCGSQLYFLNSDSTIECHKCKELLLESTWGGKPFEDQK